MNDDEMLAELRTFIANEFLDGRDAGLDADTPLLEWGVIDSISVSMLTAFVKERFGIDVPQSEVTAENLENLKAFTALLSRLQATAPS